MCSREFDEEEVRKKHNIKIINGRPTSRLIVAQHTTPHTRPLYYYYVREKSIKDKITEEVLRILVLLKKKDTHWPQIAS